MHARCLTHSFLKLTLSCQMVKEFRRLQCLWSPVWVRPSHGQLMEALWRPSVSLWCLHGPSWKYLLPEPTAAGSPFLTPPCLCPHPPSPPSAHHVLCPLQKPEQGSDVQRQLSCQGHGASLTTSWGKTFFFLKKKWFINSIKTFLREIKEDLNKQKDFPCSWVGVLNIIKM